MSRASASAADFRYVIMGPSFMHVGAPDIFIIFIIDCNVFFQTIMIKFVARRVPITTWIQRARTRYRYHDSRL